MLFTENIKIEKKYSNLRIKNEDLSIKELPTNLLVLMFISRKRLDVGYFWALIEKYIACIYFVNYIFAN